MTAPKLLNVPQRFSTRVIEGGPFMSAQRKSHLPTMTARDREFDALLRRAAQHFQQVTMAGQTQKTSLKNASIVAIRPLGLLRLAKG